MPEQLLQGNEHLRVGHPSASYVVRDRTEHAISLANQIFENCGEQKLFVADRSVNPGSFDTHVHDFFPCPRDSLRLTHGLTNCRFRPTASTQVGARIVQQFEFLQESIV